MSLIFAIHHTSVIVAELERALAFYVDLLGLEIAADRPEMSYNGAWLAVGDQQLHLLELPNPDPLTGRPEHVGRDRHTAFKVRDLDEIEASLQRAGIGFSRSRSGRRALFCRDPDGNGIELIEMGVFPVI